MLIIETKPLLDMDLQGKSLKEAKEGEQICEQKNKLPL